ncbi:nucleoside phosphorylase [Erysipelothrix sp. HDW6C]|uniref:nucleoside phosphorylase n=1 Tax=Erysipelothrix sp. HDW6C TaxID=2714930 RepID=UPI00140A1493|nr:nucleoside phosphorylase [Erysipelothrix sp. HDW6C]QIK69535.1 nucleoside phosphorylase [Erysipelothrix sp. HDW6C]
MSIHLKGLKSGDLGEVTLIVGDPGRVDLIASLWDNVESVVDTSREFVLKIGEFKGRRVSVCSTGIGVGSTEIAITELLENDAKMIIRCGGCGAWRDGIAPGDIILNSGMARSEGMLSAYVPMAYPAVADPLLLAKIHNSLLNTTNKVHVGIGLTSETYYHGQGRTPSIQTRFATPKLIEYWEPRGILNCEMETAVLYILGSLYNIPVANCLVVHVSRSNEKWTSDEDYQRLHKAAAERVLVAALNL